MEACMYLFPKIILVAVTDILLLLVLISASVNGVGMSGYLGLVDPLNYVPNVGVTIGISHELEEGEE